MCIRMYMEHYSQVRVGSSFLTNSGCGLLQTWQFQLTMIWRVSYRSLKTSSFPSRRCPSSMRPNAHNQVAPIRPMNHVEFATCGFAMAILEDARLATRGRCAEAA